jgi:threonine/homoserine/homoserine lactone efflux protein
MELLYKYILAWSVGVISGLLVSIPVGPINITIINEGAKRGFRWAVMISLGSVTMELIYCTIGFAGFSELFDSRWIRACMELIGFLLMLFLGIKYSLLHSIPTATKTEEDVERRFHPHTAFMTGFIRTLGNPGVLLGWIAISAAFIAHEWVQPTWDSKLICITGVGVGGLAWFLFMSYVASLGKSRLSTNTLLRLSQISGGLLLVMAAIIASRIIRLLAHR